MKEIELTKNKKAIVDDDDYELIMSFGKWYASEVYLTSGAEERKFYAEKRPTKKQREKFNQILESMGKRKLTSNNILMHRLIMNFPSGDVDHINGNSLDNRKENLRICTRSQNSQNKKIRKDSLTGIKGVSEIENGKNIKKRWRAYIKPPNQKKRIHLGYFHTKEEAALAYNVAAKKYFGEFAYLNKI